MTSGSNLGSDGQRSERDLEPHRGDSARRHLAAWPDKALGIASSVPSICRTVTNLWIHYLDGKPGMAQYDVAAPLAKHFTFRSDSTPMSMAQRSPRVVGAPPRSGDFAYVTVGTGVGVGLVVDGASHTASATPNSAIFASPAKREMIGKAAARFMAIASKVSLPAWRSRRAPASRRVRFLPTARSGSWSRMRSRNCCTPWCWQPRRAAFSSAAALSQDRPRAPRTHSRGTHRESERLSRPRRHLPAASIGYVVPPGLGSLAGPLGALALAADAL